MRNPSWILDELILALDVYISRGKKLPLKNSPEVRELSSLLCKYWRAETNRTETFRNVNGVYMKISNFLRFDPDYTGSGRVGLSRGNKLERMVWDEYANAPKHLRAIAGAIRSEIANTKRLAEISQLRETNDSLATAKEGSILTRVHKVRERSPSLAARKKQNCLLVTGELRCEVCGFNFQEIYGERGVGFIECHHVIPLCELSEKKTTTLDDLALVCANCHCMLHSQQPWLSVDELKELVNSKNKEERNLL